MPRRDMGDEEMTEQNRATRGGLVFVVNDACPTEIAAPSGQKGKKRPHYKSRRGCLACKRRRVKCDEQLPCSYCLKRDERCIHASARTDATDAHTVSKASVCAPQPSSHPMADDAGINLLHLELFYHFQREVVDTLAFPEIWQQVLPWSFQEPYIMSTILCLAATHLSVLRPEVPRNARIALRLLGKSVALFRGKLASPVTSQNIEALIATSILMHYVSWSHVDFLDEQERAPKHREDGTLATCLLQDPLLQLSFGVRGLFYEAYPILWGGDSVFLSASLYSPRVAIERAIVQHGDAPGRFVGHFMALWDDPQYRPQQPANADAAQTLPQCPVRLHSPTDGDPRRAAFERIARRLSLLLCLVSISHPGGNRPPPSLVHIQGDIERCFFSFPVLCGVVFHDRALQENAGALVVLYHFYKAARIMLTTPASWWARQRSRVMEPLILRDLTSRGLDKYVVDDGSWKESEIRSHSKSLAVGSATVKVLLG